MKSIVTTKNGIDFYRFPIKIDWLESINIDFIGLSIYRLDTPGLPYHRTSFVLIML